MLSPQKTNSASFTADQTDYQFITMSNQELITKLAHLSAIFEQSEDSIISKNLDGTITSWNPASEKLYGYSRKEAIGRNVLMIYPPELKNEFRAIMDKLKRGETIEHYDTVRLGKDGKRRYVSVSISPIKDQNGKIIGASHIGRDVKERVELERRKDDFISIASHELKTPLTTMKGFIQILQQGSKNFSPNQCMYLDKMNKQIDKLALLVSDLLDVSLIKQGKFDLKMEWFDLSELIFEVVNDFQNWDHQIIVKAKPNIMVQADKNRISQVLINLISNAIKYSPQADQVIVSVQKLKEGVQVSVQDFGIGIFKKDQERIFERFFQAPNKIRNSFAGLGLGLFICAEIVKQHGGRIWVESEKGQGSTFFFRVAYQTI